MESLIKRRPYLSEKKQKNGKPYEEWLSVGVDVGGTYIDVFVLNLNEGAISVAKVPTTAPDQSEGF